MSLEVTVYTVEAGDGENTPYPESDYSTFDYEEAVAYAQERKLRVIGNEYVWEDSELLNDFTEAREAIEKSWEEGSSS